MFFPLGLSIFGVAAWFPFDKGQSIVHEQSAVKNSFSTHVCFDWICTLEKSVYVCYPYDICKDQMYTIGSNTNYTLVKVWNASHGIRTRVLWKDNLKNNFMAVVPSAFSELVLFLIFVFTIQNSWVTTLADGTRTIQKLVLFSTSYRQSPKKYWTALEFHRLDF